MGTRDDRDVRRLLEDTDLPETLRACVLEVAAAGSLRPTERVDVARELIAHFEDGLASGRPAEELLAAFGDGRTAARLVAHGKRVSRDPEAAGAATWLPGALADLRHAGRRLWQSPGFTAVAILSLALGIGANTAIFSVVNTLLLAEPPVERADELVNVYETDADFPYNVLSYPDYVDLREATADVFADVAASKLSISPLELGDSIETLFVELVTGNYFGLLGLEAAVGRTLTPEDDLATGAHPVVVLSHGYWQRAFAADPSIVGRELRMSGAAYTVAGVLEPEYKGGIVGLQPDVYVPAAMAQQLEGDEDDPLLERRQYSFFGKARLREGVTIERAREAAATVAADLRGIHPDAWTPDREFMLVPTRDVVIFPAFDGPLRLASWLLLGVVGLVLLIACANLASFLLARAVDRRREIAIRLSIGAGRGQLVRQLLTESVLLSLIGGAAGVALARWSLYALETADLPLPLPMTFEFAIDGRVLGFALLLSIVAGVLFGLAPALQATRTDLISTLRDESAGAGGGTRAVLRNVLVAGQVAVSVVLLVSAGLFLRSLGAIMDIDPGFGERPAGIVQFSFPSDRVAQEELAATIDTIERELVATGAIAVAGVTTNMALDQTNNLGIRFTVDGVPPPAGQAFHDGDRTTISPGFLEATGIRIVRGRAFDESDSPDGRPAAIVSAAMVERFWPGESGVGRTFRSETGTEVTIVGVAADTRMRTLTESPRVVIYRPLAQDPPRFGYLVAAARGTGEEAIRAMLETVRRVEPDATLFLTRTMDEHLSVARFPARVTAWLFGAFATLALALAAIGLYGTVSYSQSQRVREVGIRMSLGATASDVVGLLLRGGLRLVAVGAAIGLLVAAAAARVLSGLLYRVAAWDPATFGAVVVVLGAVALLASWIPAHRATRIDPVEALRSE